MPRLIAIFEHGAAALDEAGLKATFYIFTDTIDIYSAPLASTELIREYRTKGFEIGSHTTNHSDLGLLTANQNFETLTDVIANSQNLLNNRFNQETFSMSIPFGSFRPETLEYISRYFNTARSSQFGLNLATPFDFLALRCLQVLSYRSPEFVDEFARVAETYGYYLPLMYHDIINEPFDEDSLTLSFSLDRFRQTIQLVSQRDVWIDTHERVYKYIRERNALKINQLEIEDMESAPGHFSFVADDGLEDSIFNVELTLKIMIPDTWDSEVATIGIGDSLRTLPISSDGNGNHILFNCIPNNQKTIHAYEGTRSATGTKGIENPYSEISLMAHPNPFKEGTLLTIEGFTTQNLQIRLFDMHGRIVRDIHQIGDTYLLERERLNAGLYIVQLLDSGSPVSMLKLLAE